MQLTKYLSQTQCPPNFNPLWIYLLGSFLFTAVSYGLCYKSVSLIDLARITVTLLAVIGTFASLLMTTKRYEIAGLIMVVALASLPFTPSLRYAFLPVGITGIFWILKFSDRHINKQILTAFSALYISMLGAGMCLNFHYNDWLAAGNITKDTLFHSSIASMYKNYGITSIALDGLVPIHYHTLSHKIMAGLSTLSGFETLATYGYFYFLLGPLTLASAIAGTASHFNPQLTFSKAFLYTTIIVLFILAIPLFSMAGFWSSFFISESYLISLVLLLSSLTLLHCCEIKTNLDFFTLVIAFCLLISTGLSKGSTGIVGLGMFGYLAIFRHRTALYWLFLVIFSVIFYWLIINTAKSVVKAAMPVDPFSFIAEYVYPRQFPGLSFSKILMFFIVHFLPVWLCFIYGFYMNKKAYFTTFEFQTLFALFVPAAIISQTFFIPGGSAGYFSNIPSIIAIPFLIANHLVSLRKMWSLKSIKLSLILLFTFGLFLGEFRYNLVNGLSYLTPTRIKDNVTQLREIRDNSPIKTMLIIENKDLVVEKLDCRAYWLFVAVAERPLLHGMPNTKLCTDLFNYYGLADYDALDAKNSLKNIEGFHISHLQLKQ